MDRNQSQAASIVNESSEIVFREVRTEHELRQALALRYRTYIEERGLHRFQSLDHRTGLDLDAYDLTSRHFALFARNRTDELVVGTLRITGTQVGPMANVLHRLAHGQPSLAVRLQAARPAPLPMLSYLTQSTALRAHYDECVGGGEQVAEPGRFTVHSELRAGVSHGDIRPSHFLILCAKAFAWNIASLDRVLMDCDSRLAAFYGRFGFSQIPGGEPVIQPGLGIDMAALQATSASLPMHLEPTTQRLALELQAMGEASLGRVRTARHTPELPRLHPRRQRPTIVDAPSATPLERAV